MADELTISVTIAERPYRLTIKRSEEEVIRNAASEINAKIRFYAEHFAYNDKQDLLAMVSLEKTTDALMTKKTVSFNEKEIASKLKSVKDLLSENLGRN